MKHNKSGFSFVELMMVLIFFFIILASLMPMITRRHLAPPQKVNHGTYACYYDREDGILKETLIKGRKTIIDNEHPTSGRCKFEPPSKARYFYVQLIGGGGGGQDITDADLIKDEYQVIGTYTKRGSSIVWDNGYCTSKPGTICEPWMDIFNNNNEYLALVKNKRIVLDASSSDGSICSTSTSPSYSWGCGEGEKDSDPYCKIGIGSGANDIPSSCVTPTPSGFSKSAGMLQHSCTAKADQPTVCESCPTKTCNVPVTAENPTGTKDYQLTSSTNMISTRCENEKRGYGTSCHRYVELSSLIVSGNLQHITETSWGNSASLCRYIRNGDTGFSIPRQSDGSGVRFYVGDTDLLKICGGEGAQTGKNKHENPLSEYYHSPYNVKYCSTSDQYLDSANGSCLDIPGYTSNVGQTPNEYGGDGPAPATNDPDYLYPGVGIYDIRVGQKQVLPYGVGGRAGEIKTLILKSVPDDVDIEPGLGGGIGQPGGATSIGPGTRFPKRIAEGGNAGTAIFTIDANLSPYLEDGTTLQGTDGNWRTTTTEDMDSRMGEEITFSTFVKFIISYNNKPLKERLKVFGRGGVGAATMTESTCAYKYEPVTLEDQSSILETNISVADHTNIPVPTWTYDNDDITAVPCNGHQWVMYEDADDDYTTGYDKGYYDGALQIVEHATGGESGAVVISW